MSGRLATFVYVTADDVPDWAAGLIKNPDAWAKVPDPEVPIASLSDTGGGSHAEPPPRAGKGSGRDAWASYAEALGVPVDDEMGRDDIIDTIEAHD